MLFNTPTQHIKRQSNYCLITSSNSRIVRTTYTLLIRVSLQFLSTKPFDKINTFSISHTWFSRRITLNYTLRAVERLAQQFNSRSTGIVVVESLSILLIDLTAFLGNLMVLIAVSRNSNLRRTIPNMYIITLALSDFLMSITGISFTMVSVMLGIWPFGHFVYQFYGFWVLVMCAVSLQSLALTAINRYYLIARSQVQYRKIFTLKSTKIMIAVLWVMAVFAPLSYVVADHKFFFHPGKAICMHDLESLLRGYGIFLSLYVAVPLFIIVTCYSKVFIAVRKHSFNLHHRQGIGSNPARLTVEEIDLTYTSTCVVFGFLIC